jgi:hypothetical protein
MTVVPAEVDGLGLGAVIPLDAARASARVDG